MKHDSKQLNAKFKKINKVKDDYSDDELDQKHVFKLDMIKCRRNICKFSKYEFPVYSVMDIPKKFSGKIQCGLYYIETSNIYPFRGNGWYSQPIIEYGLLQKMITYDSIILEFIPYKTLQKEYFQPIINTLLDAFKNEPILQKTSVNAFIGLLGKSILHGYFLNLLHLPI